jgi:GH15 family glucan-1,4-alpha-glucosidase
MCRALFIAALATLSLPVHASHLVTGNGYGLAVVAPESAAITKFYAHPYSYTHPDPKNPYGEGIETANFINSIGLTSTTPAANISADYILDSHLIGMHSSLGSGFAFMPFGLNQNALIFSFTSNSESAAHLQVEWSHQLTSQRSLSTFGTEVHLLKFAGIAESLLLIPLDKIVSPYQPDQPLSASNSWAFISIESESNLESILREFHSWSGSLPAVELSVIERNQFESWRIQPAIHFKSEAERHLYRQSETMLRIAQSRETNTAARHNNGMILAALPDGVYFTHWVRDMAWATLALIRMGHQAEARAAILAYFNAQPTGKMRTLTNNADYQISVVRYFGDGSEEPFFTEEGQPNIEFDNWGEVLWALGEYQAKFHDPTLLTTPTYRGTVYESARDFIYKPLLANLEPYKDGYIVGADTSIWEEHQADKKHFAFSTAMAVQGLIELAPLVHEQNDKGLYSNVLQTMLLLQDGFYSAFMHGSIMHGTLEVNSKNEIDGALLPLNNLDLFKTPEIRKSTAGRMEELKVASGGYERVKSNYTDPSIFEYWYERQEFVFVDLSLAELYRRINRSQEADAMLERITSKAAADHNIIPEMYVALPCKLFPGKSGDPTGALPMVGYGAGAYILHLIERESIASNPHSHQTP